MNLKPQSPLDKARPRALINSQNWIYRPMQDLTQIEYVSYNSRIKQMEAIRSAIQLASSSSSSKERIPILDVICTEEDLFALSNFSKDKDKDQNKIKHSSIDKDLKNDTKLKTVCNAYSLFNIDIPNNLRKLFTNTLQIPYDTFEAPPSFIGRYGDPNRDKSAFDKINIAPEYSRWNKADHSLLLKSKKANLEKQAKKDQSQHSSSNLQQSQSINLLDACQLNLGSNANKRTYSQHNDDNADNKQSEKSEVQYNFANPWVGVCENIKTKLANLPDPIHPLHSAISRSAKRLKTDTK